MRMLAGKSSGVFPPFEACLGTFHAEATDVIAKAGIERVFIAAANGNLSERWGIKVREIFTK